MKLPDNTRLFDKTMGCVLRTWRKARMVYRKDNEASGRYYLKINLETGETSKYITQLDFQDMKANINHILLIGGTTKIPVIKEKLSNALGGISFIPEKGPYEPVTACSLGAALRPQHIETVIDRLPFSMLIRQGEEIQELYKAFTPTSLYQPSVDIRIKPFRSKFCLIADKNDDITFECIAPDGAILSKQRCQSIVPGKYVLEINCYGQISLIHNSRAIREEFENPAQHDLQKERWKSVLDEEEKKTQIDDNRARKYRERYFDDHNTDVG
jgi:molecular chaperone DnaK (HSP70)